MKNEPLQILVADADRQYAELICQILRAEDEHRYLITVCHSGEAAIKLCRIQSYDCVLLEYQMPDMTGTTVMEQLRGVLDEKTPPVIIMAGARVREAATQSVRVQATDFLAKVDVNQYSVGRSVSNAVEKGRLRRGIQERRRELTLANQELERQAVEIQRFYHTVSHEMKTPLAATREFVSIVHDKILGPVNEQQMEVLHHAMLCCDQITTQFNDLIDLTRLETGKLALEMSEASLATVFDRVIAMVSSSASDKSITLDCRLPDNLSNVMMDEGRMVQVLSNLLSNSIKFSANGSKVRLAARTLKGRRVQIRVSDTGCGIPKAYLNDVFDRLFQVESAHSPDSQSGLGLGLSVAREIVRGHGHELRVQSRLNAGTLFSFELDIALPKPMADAA